MALGSNLGDSRSLLAAALADLETELGPLSVASLYLTEAVTTTPQPDYLNTAATGASARDPAELLALAHRVEARHGRVRARPGAPRTLDIDLLLLGDLVRASPPPELPHPRLRSRRFVLAPLAELAPHWPVPPEGATPGELLARLPERPWVRLVSPRGWHRESA